MKMKLLLFTLVFVGALSSTSVLADTVAAPTPAPIPDSCNGMCNARCAKAGIPKRCLTYCCICYNKCKCVPSGTYGNKSECPCYRDMLNSKGKAKCP